jgi:hypothetical protein
MNRARILKLAKEDNLVLAALVGGWMKNRTGNPVTDIQSQLAYQLRWIMATTLSVLMFVVMFHWGRAGAFLVSLLFLGVLVRFWVYKKEPACTARQNVIQFVRFVQILEEYFGPIYVITADRSRQDNTRWMDVFYEPVDLKGSLDLQGLMFSRAQRIITLEKIPWRDIDCENLREELRFILENLMHRGDIPRDLGYYFSPENLKTFHRLSKKSEGGMAGL